jgi:hypothetical protein
VAKTLEHLGGQLAANAQLLRRHIEAVREISNMVAAAVGAAHDDGTYSRNISRAGAPSW